jgi:enoyl-CoA hydratase/carnithine racemase
MLLLGERITAREAEEHGLLAQIVESREELLPAAQALVHSLLRVPPGAYAATKLALNQSFRLAALVSGDVAAALQIPAFDDPEFRRRLAALAESDAQRTTERGG